MFIFNSDRLQGLGGGFVWLDGLGVFRMSPKMSASRSVVIFDVETTGVNAKIAEIISVGAVCGDEKFFVEMIPNGPISFSATNINGYTKAFGKINKVFFLYYLNYLLYMYSAEFSQLSEMVPKMKPVLW